MKNKVTIVGANILFFIFVIIFIFSQLILGIFNELFGRKLVEENIYGVLLFNEYIIILMPVVIYALYKRLDFKKFFRFNKLNLSEILIITSMAVPAYFVAAMLNSLVVYLLQFIGDIPGQPIPIPDSIGDLIVGILIVAVSPGICEEMLNRGLMLRAYERRGSIKAVVATSIIFGIFHFDITNLLGPIFLGLLIGYYVIRTDSILAGMLAHFLNNSFAMLLSFLLGGEMPEKVTISSVELAQTFLYGATGLLILGILFRIFKQMTERKYPLKPPISSIRADLAAILSHWPVISVLALYILLAGLYLIGIVAAKYGGVWG